MFLDNIRHGMPLLEEILRYIKTPAGASPALLETAGVDDAALAAAGVAAAIPGAVAFALYDTYGFPPGTGGRNRAAGVRSGRRYGRVQRRDGRQAGAGTGPDTWWPAVWKSSPPTKIWAPAL